MSHALATYLFVIPPAHHGRVVSAVEKLGWHPRPASPHASTEGAGSGGRLENFVHFMSLTVLPQDEDGNDLRTWLLIEVCADGGEADLPKRLAAALWRELEPVFEALGTICADHTSLEDRLREHAMPMGTSLLARPGMRFVGTPGMTVRRIHEEAELTSHVRRLLKRQSDLPPRALGKLSWVRSQLFDDPKRKWALFSEPLPQEARHTKFSGVFWLAMAAMRDYLWVLLPLPVLAGLGLYFHERSVWSATALWAGCVLGFEMLLWLLLLLTGNRPRRVWALLPLPLLAALIPGFQSWSWTAFCVGCALLVLALELLLLAVAGGLGYRQLRQQEDADDPLDREPRAKDMDQLMARENFRGVAQNHLAAQSRLKPGWVRCVTLRLALWTIAEVTQVRAKPGFLGKIGTIHFARWYLVPGTDRLLFLSNYDGSWQSYLEDFIARLRQGLSSVWSNTREFPKTNSLVSGGAADGTRFKRWARRQQLPTLAWFTAYRQLTTGSIRTNAAIRHGLASATTEAQAAKWLAYLGYAATDSLEEQQVPTLVFGGLAHLRFAHSLAFCLGDRGGASAWLRESLPELSYGPHDKASKHGLIVGFTITGLVKLGLPDEAKNNFPTAFQQGMGHPDRARLLGDFDPAEGPAVEGAGWGMQQSPVDGLCLVYASSLNDLELSLQTMRERLERHGLRIVHERRMAELPDKTGDSGPREVREAFGFRDGLSQPIVRGTRGWTAPENAQHVVNAGEIVLGYRDNLGKRPPTPCSGTHDYGRNGTFLVVRHLAQNTNAFNSFLQAQAQRLQRRGALGGLTSDQAQEWVASRMVGRWRDGASLVRSPETPDAPPDNDFMYGKEDPEGLRCPFGAHIRRANPRDSLDPDSKVQLAISNRHRILRVGRPLARIGTQPEGMMFMCLNADIERQFEFLQQTWLLGPNFHGLDNETDPLLGHEGRSRAMTVPGVGGPVRLEPLRRFVRTLGGGYFFLPGSDTMQRLAGATREGPDDQE